MGDGNYDTHYVIDRYSGGMRQAVKNGDVPTAVAALVGYLRRNDQHREVSLYEQKTIHRVEWREIPDPEEARDG